MSDNKKVEAFYKKLKTQLEEIMPYLAINKGTNESSFHITQLIEE